MNIFSTYPIITILVAVLLFLIGFKIAKWIFWTLAILAALAFIAFITIF